MWTELRKIIQLISAVIIIFCSNDVLVWNMKTDEK